jgi:Tfp pilus assembly protein PilN
MRAVNLIPEDAAGGGSGSSPGVLILLGGLAVLLVLVTVHVLTGNTIQDRKVELASLRQEVTVAQAQADAMRPYREFATLAKARVETVRQLASARFDWHRAFADLATVIPDDVWLTSVTGTVAPGVNVSGGDASDATTLRAAIPNPAITLTGCTVSHESVVRLISRLRLLHEVQRVSLADSSKDAGGDCQHGHTSFPQFDAVVFFAPIPVVAAAATTSAPSATPVADGGSGGTTSTPAPSAPAPVTGTTPAPAADAASQGGGGG